MRVLPYLLVAAAVSVAVGLVSDDGWAGYVVGAVLALSLWVMLLFGAMGQGRPLAAVPPLHYAGCAAAAVALGAASYLLVGASPSWAVGFIFAGVLWPVADRARRDRQPG
ncbi:hypothetical protein [Aquipuribacter hungaricus]|uniref:Integral membrane protein n=1 Tax=Aquipuribacter hungaricus TaxID=545624 RepID=A0ABV7WGM4_9MICO